MVINFTILIFGDIIEERKEENLMEKKKAKKEGLERL